MTENRLWEVLERSGSRRPPAARIRIQLANEELEAGGFPAIPEDYQELLSKANGVQSAAFMLLGTEPQPMAGGDWADAIYEATEEFTDLDGDRGKLVLGWTHGFVNLVYAAREQKYNLVDSSCGDVLRVYDTFNEFILDRRRAEKLL